MRPKPLQKKLLAMQIELEVARRSANTFAEEVAINAVKYAIGVALDVLNGKQDISHLQGLINHDEKG